MKFQHYGHNNRVPAVEAKKNKRTVAQWMDSILAYSTPIRQMQKRLLCIVHELVAVQTDLEGEERTNQTKLTCRRLKQITRNQDTNSFQHNNFSTAKLPVKKKPVKAYLSQNHFTLRLIYTQSHTKGTEGPWLSEH